MHKLRHQIAIALVADILLLARLTVENAPNAAGNKTYR